MKGMIQRREFITLLGGLAVSATARAQQGKVPAIGFLGPNTQQTQGHFHRCVYATAPSAWLG